MKDLPNRFDKSRAGYDPTRTRPPIPLEEVSDGHSHLTGEGLSESKYARSRRLIEANIDALKQSDAYAHNALTSFFHVDSGHSDLDRLKEQVAASYLFPQSRRTPKQQFWFTLNRAIDTITEAVIDADLWVIFPERHIRKTHRTQTMEENYREINRVFESWCEELSQTQKRYRNKALVATAEQMSVAKATVERAVRFCKDEKEDSQ